jgi:hypothetical protein
MQAITVLHRVADFLLIKAHQEIAESHGKAFKPPTLIQPHGGRPNRPPPIGHLLGQPSTSAKMNEEDE